MTVCSLRVIMNIATGIGALFAADIEGDVGVDPNFMTFYFSQPSLGLPSKVRVAISDDTTA